VSCTTTLNRLCERSETIQSGVRASWVATSPAAPRNDGTGCIAFLRGFVASCESSFCTRRREGTKKVVFLKGSVG